MKEETVCQESSGSDEINLVDLAIILWARKWLILGTMVIFVSTGLGYALLAPETYEYSTVIEIGTTLRNVESGDPVVLEESSVILEKLKTSYIPIAINDLLGSSDFPIVKPKITASSPKDSTIVVLKSVSSLEDEDAYHILHQTVVDAVDKDHSTIINSARRELSALVQKSQIKLTEMENPKLKKIARNTLVSSIQGEKRALDELKDRHKVETLTLEVMVAGVKAKLDDLVGQTNLIDVKLELSEKERLLVERQVEEVNIALTGVKNGRELATTGVNDATKALTLMMVENQIEMQRSRLEHLETRLTIDLKRELVELSIKKAENIRARGVLAKSLDEAKSTLSKRVSDIQREIISGQENIVEAENDLVKFDIDYETKISQQKQVVEQLQGRMDVLQNSRSLAVAIRSVDRLSPKRALIVALSGIVGGMFGIVLAFFVSFLGQVKRRQQQITVEQD